MAYERLEDLEVYQLAERIADRFYELIATWSSFDRMTVGSQLVRAADSVGANIAESYGRFHYGERIQFLYFARGSLYETRHWLRRCRQRQLLDSGTCDRAERALDDLGMKLNGYIRSKKEQRSSNATLRELPAIYPRLSTEDLETADDGDSPEASPNHLIAQSPFPEETMQPFTKLTATAVPLRAENVDTDQIIPARFLTAVTQEGMGDGLFAAWRYLPDGSPNPEFVLNKPEYQGAEILVAGRNFGTGSSREHAVWALTQYGFRAVISPSFADIFYNNSLKNGLLPVTLPEETVNMLMDLIEEEPQTTITVDLENQTVILPDGQQLGFDIDPFRKQCLLQGLDDLGYLLAKEDAIAAYEARPRW